MGFKPYYRKVLDGDLKKEPKCGFSTLEWVVILIVGIILVPAFVGIPILLGAWLYHRKKKEECKKARENVEIVKNLVDELMKLREERMVKGDIE